MPSTRVDLGDLLLQLVAVPLGEAAGDDQPRAVAVALVLRHLEDRVDRFLLGRVDERARVDDEHLGVAGVGGDLVPRVAREAEHHLAVDEVLRAAEGDESQSS